MKTLKIFSILTILALITSCEVLDTEANLSAAERLEGRWLVNEDTPLKSVEDFYDAYIDINPGDSNQIYISNFFGIGDAYYAYANITGMSITMPQQEIGNSIAYTVYGSASISANYKRLTWSFYVDDGSGIWEEVDAIFTKQDDY